MTLGAVARFLTFVDGYTDRGSSCWIWTGFKLSGYGRFRDGARVWQAHRWIYEQIYGPIADGMEPDHTCRNRACVRPSHIDPVSHKDNVLRGDSPAARQARQTHCKRGHPLSGTNLMIRPDGGRGCRECVDARNARRREEYRNEVSR